VLSVSGAGQGELISSGLLTEPLGWYTGESPWGGPVAAPSQVVSLLYRDLMAGAREAMGPHVGLFGAIEIRFVAGPVLVDVPYRVTGEVVALSETPRTEVLWFDSRAAGESGDVAAEMRMMLRVMKDSSPRYRDAAEG
jgi:hypothetical protein